ncbi:MAG TPA: DUF4364 family protein [Candidatus Galloscillospira stercoripullorum]|nr:DUF4364 family protein [Candidatus Galloscillospira stercoripullorum]
MARLGFIRDKTDIKFLILYIMARVAAPIDFATLTDLTMIDEGVDYFEFAEAVPELVATGHLTLEEDRYAITEEGRRNGHECENSLPYSVRAKCDANLARLNAALRRSAQVRSEVQPGPEGTSMVRLTLDDAAGTVMTLELSCPSQAQGERLASGFQAKAEQIYNGILELLLQAAEKKERTP